MQAMDSKVFHWSVKASLIVLVCLFGLHSTTAQQIEEVSTASMVTLEPQTSSIRHLSWLPDGRLLAADEKEVVLWNPGNSFRVFSAKIHPHFPRSLGTLEKGTKLYLGDTDGVYVASIPDLSTIFKMAEGRPGEHLFVRRCVLSPDEKVLAIQRRSEMVQLFSMADQREIGRIETSDEVRAITYLPDGRLVIATGSERGSKFDFYTHGILDQSATLPVPYNVYQVSASPDGSKLAAASPNLAIVVDVLAPTMSAARIRASPGLLEDPIWAPDSKLLVTFGSSGKVEFWDASTLKLVKQLNLQPGQTKCAAFSRDGKWFALGGGDYPLSTGGKAAPGDYRVRILPWNADPTSLPSVGAPPAGPGIRTWTSSDGRKLEASIVGLAGTDVRLRSADGKDFPVPMARLSEGDSQYIATWISQNPMAALKGLASPPVNPPGAGSTTVGYRFSVGWNKIKFDEKPKNVGGAWNAKVVTWKPKFKVTNTSGRELKNLMLVYQVQIRLDRDSKVDDYSFPTNKMLIPVIKSNQSLDIDGYGFETLDAKLKQDFITTDGSRRNKSDVILGSIVKLIHEGKIVHEYKSGTGMQDRLREKLSGLGISVQN